MEPQLRVNSNLRSRESSKTPLIIISGMHRSGTSFLARALNLSGVYLGNIGDVSEIGNLSLLGRTMSESNPKGHWENTRLVALAEECLHNSGGKWDDPPEKILVSSSMAEKIRQEVAALAQKGFLAYGFKDPRILLCLDAWRDYLPKNLVIIGIFRHPLKVAESLKLRDGFGYAKSLDLWQTYNKKLLSLLEQYPGFLLDFDWPEERLLSEINTLVNKIGLVENPSVSKWYSKDLFRSDKTFDSQFPLSDEILSIYSKLQKISLGNDKIIVHRTPLSDTHYRVTIGNLLQEIQEEEDYFNNCFNKITDQNKQFIKQLQEINDAKSTLLAVYAKRKDLRDAFPEVLNGDYGRLVTWAAQICISSKGEEEARKSLAKFRQWYQDYCNGSLALEEKNRLLDTIKSLQEQLSASNLEATHRLEEQQKKIIALETQIECTAKEIDELQMIKEQSRRKIDELELLAKSNREIIQKLEADNEAAWTNVSELEALVEESKSNLNHIRHLVDAYESNMLLLRAQTESDKEKIKELTSSTKEVSEQIDNLRRQNTEYKNQLDDIISSTGYNIVRSFSAKLDRLAPDDTKRGSLKKIAIASMKTIHAEGFRSFLRHCAIKVRKGEFAILTSPPLPQTKQEKVSDPTNLLPYSREQCKIWMAMNRPSLETLSLMKEAAKTFSYRPRISICIPVFNPDELFLQKALESVRNQIYSNWELILVDDCSNKPHVKRVLTESAKSDKRIKVWFKPKNEGIPKTLNFAFERTSGDYVVILDNDDILEPHALYEVVRFLNEKGPKWNLIYTDEALIDENDEPFYLHFRPDFSLDFLLSHQYFVHMVVVRRSILQSIGGCDETFPNVSWDYDLWLRSTTKDITKVGHIAKVLYSWRRYEKSTSTQEKGNVMEQGKRAITKCIQSLGVDGLVEDGLWFNYYRVRRNLRNEKLSIIILSRDRFLINRCIKSIELKTKYKNYEIVIVGNNFKTDEDLVYFKELSKKYKVLFYNKPFNFSAMNNYAASMCDGEHLLFLNDDTEIIESGSIEAMLEHSQRHDVGAVGAKLLFPNDTYQHVGVVMGLFNSCEHIHKFQHASELSYYGHSHAIRNYSAVTAAAVMVPRKVFEKINGFNENLAVVFNDIDFCLRIREAGYLVVYTPYSIMYHYEHASRKGGDIPLHPEHEDRYLKERWKDIIEADPYYNPNMSRYHYDCRPSFGAAKPK